jgi:Arm domain-containing DNA-binding protein
VRAQVCRTECPEFTQARNHAVELRGPYMEKRKGRHPWEILTGDFIYSVQAPGFYADGSGLYLKVDSSGSKRWILRTVVQGKRRDMGLGSCTEISLLEARARARRLRRIARQGGDPFAAREQVFNTCHPEVTQAQRDTVDLLRKAGVVVDAFVLTKLGC